MDPVVLLFRLIAKITMFEGVTRRPNLRVDTRHRSGRKREHVASISLTISVCPNRQRLLQIRGHAGPRSSSFDSFQYPTFVLEILLSAILAVYAFIALAYAVRCYKMLWHSQNYRTHDKPLRNQSNLRRYIDHRGV